LRAGENHFAEASGADGETVAHGFTVHRGHNAPLVLKLTPKFGTLRIALSVPAASVEVHLDGDPAPVPAVNLGQPLRFSIGEHHLRVSGPGYEEISRTFSIHPGDNPPLAVELRREGATQPTRKRD
jgi:hypothetical protein